MNSQRIKECTDLATEILKNFELSELPVSKIILKCLLFADCWVMRMEFCCLHLNLLDTQVPQRECRRSHGELQA